MKALALFIAISLSFFAFSTQPSISKKAASFVKSASTGIAAACCYNAAALAPFLIKKNNKPGPQDYLIAYSALPLLYTAYNLQHKVKKGKKDSQEQTEASAAKDSPRQEMSAKNVLYNVGKLALFVLHAASAAAFVVCSIEHLEKIQKKGALLEDAMQKIENNENLFKEGQKKESHLLSLIKKGLEKDKALIALIDEGPQTHDLLWNLSDLRGKTEHHYAHLIDQERNIQGFLLDLIGATRNKESYFADFTYDRCSLAHHLAAIPVLLHTGYQLLTSALQSFKKMKATHEAQETQEVQMLPDEPTVTA